jgi:hypothetical protein
VLRSIGYDDDRIEKLVAIGAVSVRES